MTASMATMTAVAALVGAGLSQVSSVSQAGAVGFDHDVVAYDLETGKPLENEQGMSLLDASDEGYHPLPSYETHRYAFTVKLVESNRIEQYRSVIQKVADELRARGVAELTLDPGVTSNPANVATGNIYVRASATKACPATALACATTYAGSRAEPAGTKMAAAGLVDIDPAVDGASADKTYTVLAHEIGHVLGLDHYDSTFDGVSQVMHSSAQSHDEYQTGDAAGLAYLSRDVKPVGHLDPVTSVDGRLRVTGWAYDPDQLVPAAVRVTVDGVIVSEKATNTARSDVHVARPSLETLFPRGFDVSADATEGPHTVCVSVLNYPRSDFAQIGSCETVGLETDRLATDRLHGSDRFESAAAVARAAYPTTAPIVVVVGSDNFPDALAAGPAASTLGGPLLLTQTAALPAATKAEIKRLNPKEVLVVGGSVAVSPSVESELKKMVSSVIRVGGTDRYETSRKVAQYAFPVASMAFVASGDAYPDALTVGAAAASFQAPMLLVGGSSSATGTSTADQMKALGVMQVRVAGGIAAVAETTVKTIASSIPDTRRIAGTDRFETAAEISKSLFSPTTTQAYIVSGMNYPDGLVAAPLAGKTTSPVYLSPGGCIPRDTITELDRLGASKLTLVGGHTVLTGAVESLHSCM